jgi:starch synthase (maltosyl-transferring)
LEAWLNRIRSRNRAQLAEVCEDADLYSLMIRCLPRKYVTRYSQELSVTVDRPLAGCSAWYEIFPRSAATQPGRHGTFKDVEERLPYIAAMGFDVVYLPPIHPIGHSFRKGPNNSSVAGPSDVGSPWAIGSEAGGHKAIHPDLGSLEDFDRLQQAARAHGMEIALDIAFQCSPDHPYVKQHPEWFKARPDGSIQYAENPPKKYQDIYPFDFETDAWRELWIELASIFLVWIERGVRIFRVDNPHTKSFAFWEWCLAHIKQQYPDVVLLAEAFTRPWVMQHLAKIGFTQSYTYFAWRNTKEELTEYLLQLCDSEMSEFLRPNFWPNTPDILPEYLQHGGRSAFLIRLVLAATLSPNYGIYGPPFEHGWSQAREFGSEEYLDSEKYQLHSHNWNRPDSLVHFIARLNQIRREQRALQSLAGLKFHSIDNPQIICYSKSTSDREETLLCLVNLDPHHLQSGWVDLPLTELGMDAQRPYQLHELLSDARYLWQGTRNYVELNPGVSPAQIFRLRRRVRQECDFEYYL